MHIEISTDTGVEKQVLSPLVSRLDALPAVGPITAEELAFYREESLFADALARGYRYLGAANCSPAALFQKLQAAGVSLEMARRVLAELTATGMLDERAGALREAEKCVAKLWGDRRILAALRAKGYGTHALAAVAPYLQGQDSILRCVRLLEKRRVPLPADEREAARLIASLTRYGYTGREIKAALMRYRSK